MPHSPPPGWSSNLPYEAPACQCHDCTQARNSGTLRGYDPLTTQLVEQNTKLAARVRALEKAQEEWFAAEKKYYAEKEKRIAELEAANKNLRETCAGAADERGKLHRIIDDLEAEVQRLKDYHDGYVNDQADNVKVLLADKARLEQWADIMCTDCSDCHASCARKNKGDGQLLEEGEPIRHFPVANHSSHKL